MPFSVIKVTSDKFVGPRYLAHVPCAGFCLIKGDEESIERHVLKFGANMYDQIDMVKRITQQNELGHSAVSIPFPETFE